MKKPLSIYIHIPFCEKRCGYCDFVSCCDLHNIDSYINKLCNEIETFDFSLYKIYTIYIGGGTPSLLGEKNIKKIFDKLPNCNGEVTIEVNPNSLNENKCLLYRAVGINRISIGVQSFNNDTLKSLGRLHTVEEAVDKIKLAGEYFNNISIDLIKDIPSHKFVKPQDIVLDIITHISIYSLLKNDQPVSEDDEDVNLPKKFKRYEVSNYAKKGYESKHNMVYWLGGDYVGFGAGAHSYIDGKRFFNSNDIMNYKRVDLPIQSQDEIRAEKIMLGLRTISGVDKKLVIDKEKEIEQLIDLGLIKIIGNKIIATEKGFLFLNQIWHKLV